MGEKMPLSQREYAELKHLFGLVSAMQVTRPYLEKRLRTVPGAWRDFRLVQSVSQKLLERVLRTVPVNKLHQISGDLKNLRIDIRIDPFHRPGQEQTLKGYEFVPVEALQVICGKATDAECMFCGKHGRAARKCTLRKALLDTFPYEIPGFEGDECPLAGSGLFVEGVD